MHMHKDNARARFRVSSGGRGDLGGGEQVSRENLPGNSPRKSSPPEVTPGDCVILDVWSVVDFSRDSTDTSTGNVDKEPREKLTWGCK